jgi:hypothetical protein
VLPPSDGFDTARTEGTVRITDDCVFLVSSGGPVELLWPANLTVWDAAATTVLFINLDGTRVRITDGIHVTLGGGGDSNGESGTTEAWLARIKWVAQPALSCPLESRWAVGAVGP